MEGFKSFEKKLIGVSARAAHELGMVNNARRRLSGQAR